MRRARGEAQEREEDRMGRDARHGGAVRVMRANNPWREGLSLDSHTARLFTLRDLKEIFLLAWGTISHVRECKREKTNKKTPKLLHPCGKFVSRLFFRSLLISFLVSIYYTSEICSVNIWLWGAYYPSCMSGLKLRS